MLREERLKLPLLMTLHLIWGAVLWLSISKYGLGVSTDAVHLLFGAENLSAGDGLRSYDGSFIALWPPLYPALMALVRLVTGLDIMIAATILQAVAFVAMGFVLSILFLRIFRGQMLATAAALLLAQAGEVVVSAAGTVGSDYVHLLLVNTVILLTARYLETGSRATFIGLAIATTLAPVQRYIGVAATATAIAAIILLGRASRRRRLLDALVLGLTALPGLLWLALTSPLYARRAPITFAENFDWFSRSMLEWFMGPIARDADLRAEPLLMWTLMLALAAAALVLARKERLADGSEAERPGAPPTWPYVEVLMLYALFYGVALFGAASIAYFNKLGGRFILPLYTSLMALPLIVADGLVQAARRARRFVRSRLVMAAGTLAIAGLAVAVMRTTYPVIAESRARGVASPDNSLNNERWHENAAIVFWKAHVPAGAYLLISNEPDGVAFHTRHAVMPAPRRVPGPYGTDVTPVTDYDEVLFDSGLDVYLIWIEPSSYDYYYAPQQLEEIAELKSLFSNETGSVYRLSPMAPK